MTVARTSQTDPLRVDVIDAPEFPGRLGVTFAPGKKGPSTLSFGAWDRYLTADLDTLIHLYETHTLVSLMEDHTSTSASPSC